MMRREKLIAVISSEDLHVGGEGGYSLVVTDSRIIGANKGDLPDFGEPYLWLATESSQEELVKAEATALGIIGRKRFDLSKDSIFKILYEAPGLFFGGRVVFETVGKEVQLDVSAISVWNSGGVLTVGKLISSLLIFAPDKLYDEKTGAFVSDIGPRNQAHSTTLDADRKK